MTNLLNHAHHAADLSEADDQRFETYLSPLREVWLRRITVVATITFCVAAALVTWATL